MTIRWPDEILAPASFAADIAPRNLRSAASIAGLSQVISSGAGIWVFTLGGIAIRRQAQRLAWRGLAAILEGMLTPILIPLCRGDQPYTSAADYVTVPHDDDMPFDDDTEYVGTVIDVTTGGAAVGAVSMAITVVSAVTIQSGQHFSIGERLYRIRSLDGTTLTFRPPLREAVASGTSLNFDDPVCRCRLASDREMDLEFDLRRFGAPTVRFIEDV